MEFPALIVLAFFILGFVLQHFRRNPRNVAQSWAGSAIAILVSIDGRARLKGNDDPLSVKAVVRRSDGSEWYGPWIGTEDLPDEVRSQVFAHSWAIEQYSPRLNLSREENRRALEQARRKGESFRFDLPTPHPVTTGTTTQNRRFIRGWG